jgi:hypothetical protein
MENNSTKPDLSKFRLDVRGNFNNWSCPALKLFGFTSRRKLENAMVKKLAKLP